MVRRIYIASSWKNAERVRDLAVMLRRFGHDVFDFTDMSHRSEELDNFVFGPAQWKAEGKVPAEMEYKEFLDWPLAQRALTRFSD